MSKKRALEAPITDLAMMPGFDPSGYDPSSFDHSSFDHSSFDPSSFDQTNNGGNIVEDDKVAKKQRRLVKNREAAAQFRHRQKAYMQKLEKHAEELAVSNVQVNAKIELLDTENKLMKEQLSYLRNFMKQAVALSFPGGPLPSLPPDSTVADGNQPMSSQPMPIPHPLIPDLFPGEAPIDNKKQVTIKMEQSIVPDLTNHSTVPSSSPPLSPPPLSPPNVVPVMHAGGYVPRNVPHLPTIINSPFTTSPPHNVPSHSASIPSPAIIPQRAFTPPPLMTTIHPIPLPTITTTPPTPLPPVSTRLKPPAALITSTSLLNHDPFLVIPPALTASSAFTPLTTSGLISSILSSSNVSTSSLAPPPHVSSSSSPSVPSPLLGSSLNLAGSGSLSNIFNSLLGTDLNFSGVIVKNEPFES